MKRKKENFLKDLKKKNEVGKENNMAMTKKKIKERIKMKKNHKHWKKEIREKGERSEKSKIKI